MFLHFGPNTFTDSEWGTGRVDPTVFNPAALDARQWARAAAEGGFSRLVITAKHHDGFCLWPSAYTNYSVRSSPWRDGRGDVVAELAAAAREAGVEMGIYLSPWDRHEPCYGKTTDYNEYFLGQMAELLTGSVELLVPLPQSAHPVILSSRRGASKLFTEEPDQRSWIKILIIRLFSNSTIERPPCNFSSILVDHSSRSAILGNFSLDCSLEQVRGDQGGFPGRCQGDGFKRHGIFFRFLV